VRQKESLAQMMIATFIRTEKQ